jgi:hypothetical protein
LINANFRPLPKWSELKELQYRRSQFRSDYTVTLNTLEYELNQLEADNIVIEAGFDRAEIRNDGWPYSGKLPRHPGIILYFRTPRGGDMRIPCGTYDDYRANMHAIALTLAKLRDIDRYGVTFGNEQYQGFKQIAPPADQTPRQAAELIAKHAGISQDKWNWAEVLHSPAAFKTAWRLALSQHHPDKTGGNQTVYDEIMKARSTIENYQNSRNTNL